MNMKLSASAVALFFACGDPGTLETEELGSAQQAEYVSGQYGIAPGGGRCTTSEGYCYGPKRKNRKWKFYASTCSTWWQTRVVEAWYDFMELDYLGWTLEEGTSSNADIKIYCGECPGNWFTAGEDPNGCAVTNQTPDETTWMPDGLLWGEKDKWKIYLDTESVQSNWGGLSENQKQNDATSLIRHELGHAYGFGHNPYTSGTSFSVMSNLFFFNFAATFNVAERTWLGCYNPSNLTTPDLPCGAY